MSLYMIMMGVISIQDLEPHDYILTVRGLNDLCFKSTDFSIDELTDANPKRANLFHDIIKPYCLESGPPPDCRNTYN